MKKGVSRALSTLDPREERVIRLRFGIDAYGETHSLEKIGKDFGLTRERIRQIHDQVKNAFRKNIHDMMQNPCTMAPEDEMNWQLALKIYEEERGYNIQLIERENIGTAEERGFSHN